MKALDPVLRAADARDLPAVSRLVSDARLPLDGLTDFFPAGYAVAVDADGSIAGVAGLEVHGREGLLRSVAVAPAARGRGIGSALVRDRVDWGRARGLSGIHLLTADADRFFARFGFVSAGRDELPSEIRASILFVHACPETVAAMSLGGLGRAPSHPALRLPGALIGLALLLAPTLAGAAPGDL